MNRTDRLYALREELRRAGAAGRSAEQLADRFEVSARTVKRDISALQQGGFPVWARPGPGGGYAVEAEATLHPLSGWNLTTAYSHIVAIVTSDTSLPYGTPTLNAPRNIFSVWSTYEIPRGAVRGLGFGVGGRRYTDQSGDLANSFQLPGYGVVDASVTYRRGPSTWQMNLNNLGNTRYWAGSYSDLYVKPGIPREIRGTVSWNF